MTKNLICGNCNRLIAKHTQDELFSCQLQIAKKAESKITENEIIDNFNEIKSGEFSRMNG